MSLELKEKLLAERAALLDVKLHGIGLNPEQENRLGWVRAELDALEMAAGINHRDAEIALLREALADILGIFDAKNAVMIGKGFRRGVILHRARTALSATGLADQAALVPTP